MEILPGSCERARLPQDPYRNLHASQGLKLTVLGKHPGSRRGDPDGSSQEAGEAQGKPRRGHQEEPGGREPWCFLLCKACPSPISRIVAPSTGATRSDLAIEYLIIFTRPGSKEGDPEAARSQESPKRGTQEGPQGGARRAQKEPWPTRSSRVLGLATRTRSPRMLGLSARIQCKDLEY